MSTSYHRQAGDILEQVSDGFYVLDREWRFRYVNEKMRRALSQEGNVVGRTLWDVFPFFVGGLIEERFRTALETGTPQQFETRGAQTGRWLRVHAQPSDEGLAVAVWDLTGKERADAELRAIYDTAPVGLCSFDTDLRFVSVNDQLARWIGRPAEAHIGLTLRDVLPDQAGRLEPLLRQVIAAGESIVEYELALPGEASERERYGVMDCRPMRRPDGNVTGISVVVQDVTRRKQHEDALHHSEERFRILIDAVPELVWLAGPDGSAVTENRPFRDYFGFTFKDAEASHWMNLLHPEEYGGVMERWQYSVQTGQPFEREARLHRYDGVYRWHLLRALPVRNADGEIGFWCGAGVDLHDRKHVELQLAESRRLFRRIADTMPMVLTLYDVQEHRGVYSNAALEHLLGYAAEAMQAPGFVASLIHPDDAQRVAEQRERLQLLAEGEVDESEYRLRRADGSYCWLRSRGVVFSRSADGRAKEILELAQDVTEQKAAEEALRVSEERFRQAAEAISEVLWIIDLDPERVVYMNPAFERVYGISVEALRDDPRAWVDTIHAEDRPRVASAFDRWVRGEAEEFDIEYRVVHPDGQMHWVHDRGTLLRDAAGKPYRIAGVAEDITTRKQIEQHAHFQASLLGAVEQAVIATDLEGRITAWNRYAETLYGWTADEVLGRNIVDVTPSPAMRAQAVAIMESLRRGESWSGEFEVQRRDGTSFPAYVIDSPLLDEAGHMAGVVGVSIDISARKATEDALRESEQRFRAIFDTATTGILLTTPDSRYADVNPAFCGLLGRSRQEILGRKTDAFVAPGWEEKVTAVRDELQRTGRWHGEFPLVRADGTVVELEWWISNLSIPGFRLAVAGDITQRKHVERLLREAKEAAEAANESKSVFLANMSHEIRTPLTAMIGFASLLTRQLEGKPRSYAERIEQGGKRLTETLSAILTLARLETGRAEVHLEELDVPLEVDEAVATHRTLADKKGLSLDVDVTSAARHARACLDRDALVSILRNLLANAIKFTDDGGITVRVDVHEASRRVRISVADTGIGIDPAFMPHLFEAFRQESSGLSRSHEGNGLGLSIARQLAEKMGGTIEVSSEKNRGSCFTVSFPLAAGRDVHPGEGAGEAESARRLRMLVVEDNDDTRLLIETLLGDRYDVVTACNEDEAMDAAQAAIRSAGSPVDFILFDLDLDHGQDGAGLLKKILALPSYQSVPVGALTADVLPGDPERFLHEGFTAYLRKPFVPDELDDLVTRLLKARIS